MSGIPNCGKCNKPKSECNCGRPEAMTKDVLTKLEDAFMFCYTDKEACLYADISEKTLYRYQEKHPEFRQRKEILRLTPNLSAKKELVAGIKGNLGQARWWAANKMNQEFGERTTISHEGSIDMKSEVDKERMAEVMRVFNEGMRKLMTKTEKDKSPLQVTNKDVEPLKIKPNENIKRETTNIR